jgi:hypothetical protein
VKFSTLVAFSERGDENLLPKRDTQMFSKVKNDNNCAILNSVEAKTTAPVLLLFSFLTRALLMGNINTKAADRF